MAEARAHRLIQARRAAQNRQKHTHSTTDSSHPFICKAEREREGGRDSGNQEKGEKRRTEVKKETERERERETDCGGREVERVRRMVERERANKRAEQEKDCVCV